MKVYIEYAIIDNLVMDYLLLKAALKTARVDFKEIGLIFASALGTAFAVAFPLLGLGGIIGGVLKLIAGEAMVFAAAKYGGVEKYAFALALFLAYTFAAGGCMLGACYVFGVEFSAGGGLEILSGAYEISFGLIVLSGYLVSKLLYILFSGAVRKADAFPFERQAVLFDGDDTAKLSALIDSGNRLYDKRTGKPVSVLSRAVADDLMERGFFKMRGAHYQKYTTIEGGGKILVFQIDKLVIYCGEKRNIIDNAMIGVSPAGGYGETDLILHAALVR
ncbi:MAG: sigma-E processing peptidase SpoIIGA [Clostridia bacterium]|nr:sigma-E processing peptidase SpoIIGA [Clostridia bacterium]